jgi:hypothetical protein
LLHLAGPFVILPALLIGMFTMTDRLTWHRKGLLLGVPVIVAAVNVFWLIPFWLGDHAALIPPNIHFQMPPDLPEHQTHATLAELKSKLLSNRVLLAALVPSLGLAGFGFRVIKRKRGSAIAILLGISCLWTLALWFFGSFVPVIVRLQPVRFVLPGSLFLAVLIGPAMADLTRRGRISPSLPVVLIVAGLFVAGWVFKLAPSLAFQDISENLAGFVATRTEPGDRLMVQTYDGYRYREYHSQIYPLQLNREVIGSNFPRVFDPPQFLGPMALGQQIQEWDSGEFREALERWGVKWLFALTPEAEALGEAAFDSTGEQLGGFRVFRVDEQVDRFLRGKGQLKASINRFELSELQPDSTGLVVLRYRYYPGWETDAGIPVHRYLIPEDAHGFIALINPPEKLIIRMNPLASLRDPWAEPLETTWH